MLAGHVSIADMPVMLCCTKAEAPSVVNRPHAYVYIFSTCSMAAACHCCIAMTVPGPVKELMWLPLQAHTGTSLAEAVQDVAEHVPAAVQQLADSSLEAVDQVQEAVGEALMPKELAERRRIRKQQKDRWGTMLLH